MPEEGASNVSIEGTRYTYTAAVSGFVPVATPTDFWQIIGSATKTVRVLRIEIFGVATGATTVDTLLVKRSTATTLGGATATAAAAVPDDSGDPAATAVVNTFSVANPSPLGTLVGNVRTGRLELGVAAGAGLPSLIWEFGIRGGRAAVLRGVAQQLALNWAAVAVPAGTLLDINVEWLEDNS